MPYITVKQGNAAIRRYETLREHMQKNIDKQPTSQEYKDAVGRLAAEIKALRSQVSGRLEVDTFQWPAFVLWPKVIERCSAGRVGNVDCNLAYQSIDCGIQRHRHKNAD